MGPTRAVLGHLRKHGRAPVSSGTAAVEIVRGAEEFHVDGDDAIGEGSREHLAIIGRDANTRHGFAEGILALAKRPEGRLVLQLHDVFANHTVREPDEQAIAALIERRRRRGDVARRRDSGDDPRRPRLSGRRVADRGHAPQSNTSVARRRRHHVGDERVPHRAVTLARVLRHGVARVCAVRRVDGPDFRRAVRRRRHHPRRAPLEIHRAESLLRVARPLGLPRHVVHGGGVTREGGEDRARGAVEHLERVRGPFLEHRRQATSHRVKGGEGRFPRRRGNLRLRATVAVRNLAVVHARARVRQLDDRGFDRASGGDDRLPRGSLRARLGRRRPRVHPVAQRLVR